MEIFKLETPVKDKIESFYNARKTEAKIPASAKVEFLDFEPDESFLSEEDLDGAVAVYASSVDFADSMGSETEQQESFSFLTVDAYGFGAPIPENGDLNKRLPTVREAQNRAEVLITLGFQALVDRREMEGSPDEGIEKQFGSGVDYGVDKYPVSIKKFSPQGTMNSNRGICIYRMVFKFRLEETAITEALGLSFAGSDNLFSETYDPGSEPEGV